MSNARNTQILAIDGRGTLCRVASADRDSVVSLDTGSAKTATEFDGSIRERGAVRRMLGKAGRQSATDRKGSPRDGAIPLARALTQKTGS